LSGIANQLIDKFFIANMINVSQAGIYALGGQIVSILGIVNVALNRTLTPRRLEAFKKKDYEFLKNLSLIVISFVAILTSFLILFSKEIIQLIAPDSYQRTYIVINILSFYFVYQMYYFMVVGVLFYVERATKFVPLITFSSFLLNIAFNYVFIKSFNVVGAALATTLTMIIITYMVIFTADKYVKIGFNHMRIHLIILLLICIAFLSEVSVFITKAILFMFYIVLLLILERRNPLVLLSWRKLLEKHFRL
jgi:O-antigen/teichoic acid export membrane protein